MSKLTPQQTLESIDTLTHLVNDHMKAALLQLREAVARGEPSFNLPVAFEVTMKQALQNAFATWRGTVEKAPPGHSEKN